MYYVYVLKSLKDGDLYVGKTANLRGRIKQHNDGRVPSTCDRRPLKFIYYEAGNNSKDASHRELYLKTAWGKRYLKLRVKNDI